MDGFRFEPGNALERRQVRRYRSELEEALDGEDAHVAGRASMLFAAYCLGAHDAMSRAPKDVCRLVIDEARQTLG